MIDKYRLIFSFCHMPHSNKATQTLRGFVMIVKFPDYIKARGFCKKETV